MVARVAAAWPERLRRGVTIAVPPPAALAAGLMDPAQQQRLFYIFLFTVEGVAEAVLNADRRLVDYLWATWSPRLKDLGAHRDRVHAMYGDERFIDNALKIYRANFDPGRFDPALVDFGGRSAAVASKPLLVLGGGDDGCISPRMYAEAEKGLAAGSEVEVMARVGHFLHLEQPAAVAKRILDWLSR